MTSTKRPAAITSTGVVVGPVAVLASPPTPPASGTIFNCEDVEFDEGTWADYDAEVIFSSHRHPH